MNVLYVTPDLGESDILRREFSARHPDLRLESTATPREAIKRLDAGTSHYDAVLIELTQMNGEGLSLVRHIRKNNLPVGVVAIAAVRDDAPSQEVLESGADHVVVKGKEFLPRLSTVLARAVERRTFEARLRAMLETAPVCLMRVAGDGNILAMNIAALDMVEAERAEQMVDESWYERVVPDAQAACRDFIERASQGEKGSFECQIKRLSGTHRTVLMGAVRAPVDADGAPSALVAMRDLDTTRRLEVGLTQGREKLGALETALSELKAQNQQLVAGHEAERAEWQQQQSSTDLTAERATWEQAEVTRRQELVDKHQAEREALEHALKAAEAQCQQLSADHEAERAEWQQQQSSTDLQAEATRRQELVDKQQTEREATEHALKAAEAQCRQLSADHDAERAKWQQQSSTDLTAERAAWEQAEATRRQELVDKQQTEREALEYALKAAEAQSQQLSADHKAERAEWQQQQQSSTDLPAERAAWEQAEATRRQELVDKHQAERETLEYALKAAEAQCQQLSADHEAERTKWQKQLAMGKAQEEAVVEQLFAEHEKLESALQAAAAQQQSSTDLTAERAAWEQAEATGRQEFVNKHRAEREATEHALKAAEARCQQLSADHEAERTKWQEQLAAGKAQETALKRQPLAISRKPQGPTRTMDLNAAIGQLGPVLSRLVGEDIELGVEPASQLDPVEINPDHVEQLLLRLAVMVREAMPAGGIVRLGTSSVQIDDAHVHEHPGVPPGPYARLTLKASGWGMDPQMQDRVASAVASGEDLEGAKELGLASALRAFRQAGGHIAVKVEPGRELSFEGYLSTGG